MQDSIDDLLPTIQHKFCSFTLYTGINDKGIYGRIELHVKPINNSIHYKLIYGEDEDTMIYPTLGQAVQEFKDLS